MKASMLQKKDAYKFVLFGIVLVGVVETIFIV